VLFSDKSLADYISKNFEPCWESVRPVPTLTLDFGNGRTITRTLNGNIATYVCNSDGTIRDILPGIYSPSDYGRCLSDFAGEPFRAKTNSRFAEKDLALDTRENEVERRAQIRRKLASMGPTYPNQIKRWLYKEILHADLDDPYLGLGPVVFAQPK
jgi:hypothetical protein